METDPFQIISIYRGDHFDNFQVLHIYIIIKNVYINKRLMVLILICFWQQKFLTVKLLTNDHDHLFFNFIFIFDIKNTYHLEYLQQFKFKLKTFILYF